MSESPISLSFSISDNYTQHLAVVVASALQNNPESSFLCHVLTKGLSEENIRRLHKMESERCTFVIHTVDHTLFDRFPLPIAYISQEMYYRYLLPELLADEKRTLYLDVDLLVLGDLRPLWAMDLEGNLLGGMDDGHTNEGSCQQHKTRLGLSTETCYINSGVLLMELGGLRSFDFATKCMNATQRLRDLLCYPDQDVINVVLNGKIKTLSPVYNCIYPQRLKPGEQIVIRHFATAEAKPWYDGNLVRNHTWRHYLRYLLQTPFRDQAWRFAWPHIKRFFFFHQQKNSEERLFLCGFRVWKKRLTKSSLG